MPPIPVGVANSVSANFDFDPINTIQFARQSGFEIIQIYLNSSILENHAVLKQIREEESHFQKVYYHAEGFFNTQFFGSDYQKRLFDFLTTASFSNFILHFDEQVDIDGLLKYVESYPEDGPQIYLENFFQAKGPQKAEKNLKKYLALFTLLNMSPQVLKPVLDIPRIFHKNLGFTSEESIQWCYQLFNYFGNRQISILLHLIDVLSSQQERKDFIALGKGCIPYSNIFNFIVKTQPTIEGIILEYEDKLNPLQSREFLQKYFFDLNG